MMEILKIIILKKLFLKSKKNLKRTRFGTNVWYGKREGARSNRSVTSRPYVFLGIPQRSSCSMSEKEGIQNLTFPRRLPVQFKF